MRGVVYEGRISCFLNLSSYDPDWYENALKDPEVEVQIGKRHIKGQASSVEDLEEKAEAYRAIVKAQGEKSAEQYYYVKPGMDEKEIGSIGEGLPIMRIQMIE